MPAARFGIDTRPSVDPRAARGIDKSKPVRWVIAAILIKR
jgi:hypothetical protein